MNIRSNKTIKMTWFVSLLPIILFLIIANITIQNKEKKNKKKILAERTYHFPAHEVHQAMFEAMDEREEFDHLSDGEKRAIITRANILTQEALK